MQPVAIREQVLVYRQLKLTPTPASKKGQAKPQAQPKLSYHKLIRDLNVKEKESLEWKLRMEQVPDSGVKNVISQPVSERVLEDGELDRFHAGSEWYKYTTQYTITGHRFVNSNVVTLVYRVMVPSTPPTGDVLGSCPPPAEYFEPMDPSGVYVVESYVAAEDGISTELREKGIAELLRFAKEVEGVLDLRVRARLALDPSVKGV